MELRYDQEADALYVAITEEPISRTEEIDTGTLVDLDRMGVLVGIEILHPARPWPLEEIGVFGLPDEIAAQLAELQAGQRHYPFAQAVGAGRT